MIYPLFVVFHPVRECFTQIGFKDVKHVPPTGCLAVITWFSLCTNVLPRRVYSRSVTIYLWPFTHTCPVTSGFGSACDFKKPLLSTDKKLTQSNLTLISFESKSPDKLALPKIQADPRSLTS